MQVKNEQMRKRILEVAEKFFLTKGFKETTMKDIAAKVPTAVGNLYTYFHSKSEILDALVYPSFSENVSGRPESDFGTVK